MAAFETRKPDWLSFDEALRRVDSFEASHPPAPVPMEEALGLALADEVSASLTLPPGPSSHMDGYAARANDIAPSPDGKLIRVLRVVGAARPGAPLAHGVTDGCAVRIMTGALLPAGADTVIPVEETDREEASPGEVRISLDSAENAEARRGRYVRPAGEEMMEGERLAAPGDTVTPGLLALLAATGEPKVSVHPASSVALIVTGDELVPTGNPAALEEGVFRADVLTPSLPPLIKHAGGVSLSVRRVGDDPEALRVALAQATAEADLVVTTGGASMGEADLVKRVLDGLGLQLDFWRVLMRPGSPVSLGSLPDSAKGRRVPILGLPGNPVSALVTFLVLGYPAVRALSGHTRRFLPTLRAIARERFAGPAQLTRFFRVRIEPESSGTLGAWLSAPQGSGVIQSMASADGLAIVPEGAEATEEGQPIQVLLLPYAAWAHGP